MLLGNKKERVKTWFVTFCSIGVLVSALEVLKMCTRC